MFKWLKNLFFTNALYKPEGHYDDDFGFNINDDGSILIYQPNITCTVTRETDNSINMYVSEVDDHLTTYVDVGKTYNCFLNSHQTYGDTWEIDPKYMKRSTSQFLIYHNYADTHDPEEWAIELDF